MNLKISHYVAEIDGKSVYETSHTVHDEKAWICRAFDHCGEFLSQYVNPLEHAFNGISEHKHVRMYAATRFMTEKKKEFIQAQYHGGVEDA